MEPPGKSSSGDWSAYLLDISDGETVEYEFSPAVLAILGLEPKSPSDAAILSFKALRPDNWRTQLRDARGRWVEQWSDSLPTDPFGESAYVASSPPPTDPSSKTRFTVSPHGDGYAIFDNGEFHSIPESGTWGAAKKIANRLNDDQRTVKMKYQPQLAKDGGTTFHHGPEWMVQRKWDGVRAIFEVTEDDTKVFSRTGQDLRPQFPEFNDLHEKFPPGIYDGEILALDENGQDDLERIQLRINDKKARKVDELPVTVKFFDILEEDGKSTQDQSAEERLATLEDAVGKENTVEVLPANFKVEDIPKNWEGTMSKLRASKYEVGKRRSTWMKYKLKKSATLKVTGLTEGLGSRKASFGAVLVSDANGVPRGQIGSGFTQEDIDTLLEAQKTGDWPLIEVEYRFLSKTGLLTNTAYKGIRHDKDEADRFDGTDGGEATPEEGVAVTVTEGTPNPSKATAKDPTAKIRWWREELATATLANDPDRVAKAEAKLSGLRKFAIANGFDPQNSAFELPEDDLPDGAMQWSRPKKTTGGATIHQSGKYSIESYKDGDAYNTPTQATLFRDGKLVGRFLSVTQAKEAAERDSELPDGSMSDTEFRDYQDRLRTLDIGELENEDYTLRNERQYLDKLTDQEVSDRLGAVESEMIRRTAERLSGAEPLTAPKSQLEKQLENVDGSTFLTMHMPQTFSGWKLHINMGGDVEREAAAYELLRPLMEEQGMGLKLATNRFHGMVPDGSPQRGKDITIYLPRRDEAQAHAAQIMEVLKGLPISGDIQNDEMLAPGIGLRFEFKSDPGQDISMRQYHDYYAPAGQSPDLPLPKSSPGPEAPTADRIAFAVEQEPSLVGLPDEIAWRLYEQDEVKFPGQWDITAGGTSGQEMALSEYTAEVDDWLDKNSSQVKVGLEDALYQAEADLELFRGTPREEYYQSLVDKILASGGARSKKGKPATETVSLQYLTDRKLISSSEEAIAAIDSVHRMPVHMTGLPIKQVTGNDMGRYRFRVNGNEPVSIELNKEESDAGSTLAHEMGHYLDHWGLEPELGPKYVWASDTYNSGVSRIVDIARLSKAFARLSKWEKKEPDYYEYITGDKEIFARAYAQWISLRSGKLKGIKTRVGQWTDDDFQPIAVAMDDLFAEKGLLK